MKMSISFFFSFCFLIVSVYSQCSGRYSAVNHTMCLYQTTSPNVITSGVTSNDILEILQTHNNLRNYSAAGLVPGKFPASNMRQMVWSSELAAIAQRLANTSVFEHDQDRSTKRFPFVGQNLAAGYPSWTNAITAWFDEYNFYPNTTGSFASYEFIYQAGHYTQVIWAESYVIGCGFVTLTGQPYSNIMACNYGPAGNFIDSPIHSIGTCATACPVGTVPSFEYSCLCKLIS
eukprot:TRINITY_DN44_c4_g1_i1.p1 TRINITY_DN44_c4_g1~~TRINITY_DN44_c4_g1_i1.p1  ORF type:complete len:232 (+),score=53.80 TRINITY_DN44_c4_g1_i1:147-842(+)